MFDCLLICRTSEFSIRPSFQVALLLMLHGADFFRKNANGKSPIELAPNEAFRKQLLNDFYGCKVYDAAANGDISAVSFASM